MKKILIISLFCLSCLPLFAFAQVTDPGTFGSPDPKKSTFQLVSCAGVDDPRTPNIKEAECNYAHIVFTATRIIQFVLYMISFIVLVMILVAGFQYMTSGGDAKKAEGAKKMIKPIVFGLFFIFAAYLIVYKLILGNLLAEKIGDINKSSIIETGGRQ
jgi:hypothetical protein